MQLKASAGRGKGRCLYDYVRLVQVVVEGSKLPQGRKMLRIHKTKTKNIY